MQLFCPLTYNRWPFIEDYSVPSDKCSHIQSDHNLGQMMFESIFDLQKLTLFMFLDSVSILH